MCILLFVKITQTPRKFLLWLKIVSKLTKDIIISVKPKVFSSKSYYSIPTTSNSIFVQNILMWLWIRIDIFRFCAVFIAVSFLTMLNGTQYLYIRSMHCDIFFRCIWHRAVQAMYLAIIRLVNCLYFVTKTN